MTAWVDVKFAPKDGTVVDLWCVHDRRGLSGRFPNCVWLPEPEDDWCSIAPDGLTDLLVRHKGWRATHYSLPLPGPNT